MKINERNLALMFLFVVLLLLNSISEYTWNLQQKEQRKLEIQKDWKRIKASMDSLARLNHKEKSDSLKIP